MRFREGNPAGLELTVYTPSEFPFNLVLAEVPVAGPRSQAGMVDGELHSPGGPCPPGGTPCPSDTFDCPRRCPSEIIPDPVMTPWGLFPWIFQVLVISQSFRVKHPLSLHSKSGRTLTVLSPSMGHTQSRGVTGSVAIVGKRALS